MKTVSGPLASHIARPVTTLCTCFEITRVDGTILRFTDHDQDLTVAGELYTSSVGYDRTAVENRIGANVDNLEVQFLTFTSGAISPADIRAGLYDHASVRMFVVNWASPSDGAIAVRQGYIGELTLTKTGVGKGELRGLTQVLSRKWIEIYSPECRADFGDARCKFPLETITVAGTVLSVTDRRTFTASLAPMGSPPSQVGSGSPEQVNDGDYDSGGLQFVTGANAGKLFEVREFLATGSPGVDPVFMLYLTTPYDIQIGDTFTVYPGCDKQFLTCRDRWQNTINFRGEPHVPGTDALMNVTMPGDTSA